MTTKPKAIIRGNEVILPKAVKPSVRPMPISVPSSK